MDRSKVLDERNRGWDSLGTDPPSGCALRAKEPLLYACPTIKYFLATPLVRGTGCVATLRL